MDKFFKELEDECFDVEYKEKESEGLYKTICAFANTSGGCIILGVDDNKNAVGIDLFAQERKKIADKISDTLGLHPDIKLI